MLRARRLGEFIKQVFDVQDAEDFVARFAVDRNARMAGPEEVHEPVRRDGLRAPLARLLEPSRLARPEALEELDGLGKERRGRSGD